MATSIRFIIVCVTILFLDSRAGPKFTAGCRKKAIKLNLNISIFFITRFLVTISFILVGMYIYVCWWVFFATIVLKNRLFLEALIKTSRVTACVCFPPTPFNNFNFIAISHRIRCDASVPCIRICEVNICGYLSLRWQHKKGGLFRCFVAIE